MNFKYNKKNIPLKEKINVIFEDNSIIVIDKMSGLLSQPVKDSQEPSVVELIRYFWKSKNKRQGYIGVVQRLDKETSGLLVFAKSKEAQRILQKQFEHHKIKKRYLAIVKNVPREKKGRLIGTITRDQKGKRTVLYGQETKEGKEAVTRYKVIESFKDKALLELAPETGRTHQIRLQLVKIGCPILGEPFYVRDKKRIPGCDRCALHSAELEFIHPETTKRINFISPLPADMATIIKNSQEVEEELNE